MPRLWTAMGRMRQILRSVARGRRCNCNAFWKRLGRSAWIFLWHNLLNIWNCQCPMSYAIVNYYAWMRWIATIRWLINFRNVFTPRRLGFHDPGGCTIASQLPSRGSWCLCRSNDCLKTVFFPEGIQGLLRVFESVLLLKCALFAMVCQKIARLGQWAVCTPSTVLFWT